MNFPLEIVLDNLKLDYVDGNGFHELTSFFKNDAPTYKNINGWVIQKNQVNWEISSNVDNLGILKNTSTDPLKTEYKSVICNEFECQTAKVLNKQIGSPFIKLPEINNLKITTVTDTSISVSWEITPEITGYEIEISDTFNFEQSKQTIVDKSLSSYRFENLPSGTEYFIRIRYIGYKETYTGDYKLLQVLTTLPATSADLSVNLDQNSYPYLSWILPKNINYEYEIVIRRSSDKVNWTDISKLSSKDLSREYIDKDVSMGIYYYYILFDNGNLGTKSSIEQILINESKPKKPDIISYQKVTKNPNIEIEWTNADLNNSISYLYKFNAHVGLDLMIQK